MLARLRLELVPVVVFVVLFIAVLISYPWHLLSAASIIYLCCLPVGWMSYREQQRRYNLEMANAAAADGGAAASSSYVPPASEGDDRPPHLH